MITKIIDHAGRRQNKLEKRIETCFSYHDVVLWLFSTVLHIKYLGGIVVPDGWITYLQPLAAPNRPGQ